MAVYFEPNTLDGPWKNSRTECSSESSSWRKKSRGSSMARRPTRTGRAPLGSTEYGPAIPCRIWTWKSLGLDCYHRVDGPAIESSDGTKEWWRDGIHLRIESDWQAHDTKAGMKQRIVDLEQRVMELEEEVERLKHG
jgi:hypothetical protein